MIDTVLKKYRLYTRPSRLCNILGCLTRPLPSTRLCTWHYNDQHGIENRLPISKVPGDLGNQHEALIKGLFEFCEIQITIILLTLTALIYYDLIYFSKRHHESIRQCSLVIISFKQSYFM